MGQKWMYHLVFKTSGTKKKCYKEQQNNRKYGFKMRPDTHNRKVCFQFFVRIEPSYVNIEC